MTPIKRIAVIGEQGQLATALRAVLLANGYDVETLSRPRIDLAQGEGVAGAIIATKADIVINAAAYTAVDRAEDEPETANAVNARGAGLVAAASAELGVPVIHFSTDYVFDGTSSKPYTEVDATAPQSVYGKSKLEGEQQVAAANPRHVIFRTAWVSSPHGQNFVRTMLRLAAERPLLRVVDDQHGSPTFCADLAAMTGAILPALADPDASADLWGIFHAVNAGSTTWCGLARAVMEGSAARGGPSVPIEAITTAEFPTKARRPAYSLLSTAKLRSVYGLELRPWQNALDDCLNALLRPSR